jgi:hypothetical protein
MSARCAGGPGKPVLLLKQRPGVVDPACVKARFLINSCSTLRAACVAAALLAPGDLLRSETPARPVSAEAIEAQLAVIPLADLDSRIALAESAAAHGHLESADRILRQVLAIEPGHDIAYSRLHAVAAKLPLKMESTVYRHARNLLPPRFIKTETRRFVVLSDADAHWTQTQIERVERAHHQFMRLSNRLGLTPLPLQHKLVCVLFGRQEDYIKFAGEQDGVTDKWIAGYYSPRHDWIVFYDIRSNTDVKNASAKLERMEHDLGTWMVRAQRAEHLGQDETAEAMRDALCRYHQHFAVEKQKLADFTERAAIATTVHEAIHHLMFHSRIQLRTVEYPLWISEGMATAFETDMPNAAFGPDHEFKPRRDEFVRLFKDDKLIPLRDLVTLTAMPNAEKDTISALYHGSYALVTWMCRFRADELRRYYNAMQREQSGRSTPERHLAMFESIFGDIDRLERAWIRHELNRPELSQLSLPWHRRIASDEELVAVADTPGLEQLRLAGLPIYASLFATPFAVAPTDATSTASADRMAPSAASAAAGTVTISAAPSSEEEAPN